MNKEELLALIVNKAIELKLDHELVLAFCEVESGFRINAHRFEPGWAYCLNDNDINRFALHNGITPQTERIDQMTSFGLFQVMGSVARELGYEGNLVDLYDPNYGATFGCLKIKQCLEKYDDLDDAISSYNAGSPRKKGGLYVNQNYVDAINKAYRGYQKES